jgi:transposase-like protein
MHDIDYRGNAKSDVKKPLPEKATVSDLCDQYGLHPTVFHRWMNEFFENAALAFRKAKIRVP